MSKYPKRGGDCEYTMDCMWGVDGWCDRPSGNKCEIQKMDEAKAESDTRQRGNATDKKGGTER